MRCGGPMSGDHGRRPRGRSTLLNEVVSVVGTELFAEGHTRVSRLVSMATESQVSRSQWAPWSFSR